MKRAVPLILVLALWVASAAAQTKSVKTLDIYIVDVEGETRCSLCRRRVNPF